MNCNDINLAGCRNNAIVHDPTLTGSGTGSDPLGVNIDALNGVVAVVTDAPITGDGTNADHIRIADGSTAGETLVWNGTAWVIAQIDTAEITTACADDSLLYAAGGGLSCTSPEVTFDGTNLGGTGGIDMVGANGSLKYDPTNADFDLLLTGAVADKSITTSPYSIILNVDKTTNSAQIPSIELSSIDNILQGTAAGVTVAAGGILNTISKISNSNEYIRVDYNSNRRITEIYQNRYKLLSPAGGFNGSLTLSTGNYESRDKDTVTGTGANTTLYSFVLPNTAATARIIGSIIARRTTATNSASAQINIHANWLSSNNWLFSDVGAGSAFDLINCVISVTYNNISNTVDAKIQLPNDGNQYVIFTNLEIQLLAI